MGCAGGARAARRDHFGIETIDGQAA